MDWGNVTLDELVSSLREVQWTHAPRPITEFFGKLSVAKGQQQLVARMKNNVYYYRANYVIILVIPFVVGFIRNPGALGALALCTLAGFCLNDTFAASLSDRILRVIRKVHPPTAMRIRASSGGHSGLGAPGKSLRTAKIVGINRNVLVGFLLTIGLFLFYRTRALLTLSLALLIGSGLILAHAALRSPNLKNRLNSAREEFRAVWRGYQSDYSHDYTL